VAWLEFNSVRFGFSDEMLITEASGALHPGNRVGLVGPNGGGKTTLLKLLRGELAPEAGSVQRNKQARLGYVSQAAAGDDAMPLYEYVRAGRAELTVLEARMHELHERIAHEPEDAGALRQLGEAEAQFATHGGHTWDAEVQRLLTGLRFTGGFEQRLDTLSGGQRQKANLARALLSDANCLILDEPTNHLDLDAQAFLVDYLRSLPKDTAVLLVSHDRWLLKQLATQIWELDSGVLYRYSGSYEQYVAARALRRQQQREQYERQQEQIARTEEYIRRNIAGQNTRQAQGRRTLLARMERLDRPGDDPDVRFVLTPRLRTGEHLLSVERLAFGYGPQPGPVEPGSVHVAAGHTGLELNPALPQARGGVMAQRPVIEGLEFSLLRGERLGIIGPNGCGKSTLLRLLAQQLNPQRGLVAWGSNAELGVFFQDSADLLAGRDLLAEIRSVEPGLSDGDARGYLARFGFSGDDVFADAGQLSGGERSRLSLAKIFRRRPNVLLLDEPTNHLDIYAREALEQLVLTYTGSLILVTHDRELLERLCNRLVVFTRAGEVQAEFFRGGYSDYLRWRDSQALAVAEQAVAAETAERNPEADLAKPGTLSPADLTALAREAHMGASAFCAKHRERVEQQMHKLEDGIAAREGQISAWQAEQAAADRAQRFAELTQLQERIDGAHAEIDGLFGELEALAPLAAQWGELERQAGVASS
jgi:ATP-binding cassette, subfamily F, member 3